MNRGLVWGTNVVVAVLFVACGAQPPAPSTLPAGAEPTISYPLPTPSTPTERPTPSPEPTRPRLKEQPRELALGAHGVWVRRMQRSLASASYDPGVVDGRFGTQTLHAIYAFQKVNGLEPGEVVNRPLLRLILKAAPPVIHPRVQERYVDVDIGRQVLFEVVGGKVATTLPVSTGNGDFYSSSAGLAVAHTPRGTFQIERKIAGWHVGYLGAMYYPSYFTNGYAIHGSESVPSYPASHGCVRIPIHSTVGFYERNPIGTPVYVHD